MIESSLVQTHTEDTIFHAPFHLDRKNETKRDNGKFQPSWHCFMWRTGRVNLEDGWLIKSSFITWVEIKDCQLTTTRQLKKGFGFGKEIHFFSGRL
jgi:hypothetical protein